MGRHRQGGGALAKLTAEQTKALNVQADTGAFRVGLKIVQAVEYTYQWQSLVREAVESGNCAS